MSYPSTWKVTFRDGYLTLLKAPRGKLNYELYAEENGGSFRRYREDTEASTSFGRDSNSGTTVTKGDIKVDGRAGFYIQTVYDKNEPPDWSGEEWCSGCVERDYHIDWTRSHVLNMETAGTTAWQTHAKTIERVVASLRHV